MLSQDRHFDSISPSAEFLIRLKANTTIPFAKETAALLIKGAVAEAAENSQADRNFYFRSLIHFENRYRTIDKLLTEFHSNNMMELSSGYSCRGFILCLEKEIHFIDTDLPDLIKNKRNLVDELLKNSGKKFKGHYELAALNALETSAFMKVIEKFSHEPLTIINEGLLPYLNVDEKVLLCSNIRKALKHRGGYWITGDIYIKNEEEETRELPEAARMWRQMHHTHENKFDDFESAEKFFNECGFDIVRRESLLPEELSCLELLGDRKKEIIEKLEDSASHRQTWCLKIFE
jgi:O-methyltransferase involved in polyketide biosynthesis